MTLCLKPWCIDSILILYFRTPGSKPGRSAGCSNGLLSFPKSLQVHSFSSQLAPLSRFLHFRFQWRILHNIRAVGSASRNPHKNIFMGAFQCRPTKKNPNHTSLNENYVFPCICLRTILRMHNSCYSSVARHIEPCICHIALRHMHGTT